MEDNFNQALRGIIESKIRTIFVAAVAAFEKEFGEEFGLFKDEHILTTDYEDKMTEKFDRARDQVFDVGNREMRDVLALIDNCKIDLVKGYISFKDTARKGKV